MIDAIERIEIHIRSIIAHELGQYDPLAYQSATFINPQKLHWRDRNGNIKNLWAEWSKNHSEKIRKSREKSITYHRANSKAMPFWVVIEAWDFGTMSKYFENLKPKLSDVNYFVRSASIILAGFLISINAF